MGQNWLDTRFYRAKVVSNFVNCWKNLKALFVTHEIIQNSNISVLKKVLLEHRYTIVYLLSMAAFAPQWQGWGVVTGMVWFSSLKHLLSGPLQKSLPTSVLTKRYEPRRALPTAVSPSHFVKMSFNRAPDCLHFFFLFQYKVISSSMGA